MKAATILDRSDPQTLDAGLSDADACVKPLCLLHLTRSEAQARSVLAQRVRSCAFLWGGHSWTLTLTPLTQSQLASAAESEWTLQLQWGGAPIQVVVPATAAQAWIGGQFPGLDIPELPDAFAAAALEVALTEVIEALDSLQRGPVSLRGLGRGALAPASSRHAFEFEACSGHQVVRGRLATDALGLMLMAGLVARLPDVPNELGLAQQPLRLRAEVGATWLTAQTLSQLAPGDAVMVENVYLTTEGELRLSAHGWGLRGRVDGARLTVTAPFSHLGATMALEEMPAGDADLPESLLALPLQLVFDLGERSVTLAQLQVLQVGQVLDLERPLSAAVGLRVNGRLVGTGELVEIDGRLGVCVSALAPAAVSPPLESADASPVLPETPPGGLDHLADADGALA